MSQNNSLVDAMLEQLMVEIVIRKAFATSRDYGVGLSLVSK